MLPKTARPQSVEGYARGFAVDSAVPWMPHPQVDTSVGPRCKDQHVAARFLTLADVAETLNVSAAQAYALVRSGDLPAIKVGGRGQWRVEARVLEEYIARMYSDTKAFIDTHPYGRDDEPAVLD